MEKKKLLVQVYGFEGYTDDELIDELKIVVI